MHSTPPIDFNELYTRLGNVHIPDTLPMPPCSIITDLPRYIDTHVVRLQTLTHPRLRATIYERLLELLIILERQ